MKKYIIIPFIFLFFNTYAQIQGTYQYADLDNGFSILRENGSGLNGIYNQNTNKLVLPIKYESLDILTDQLLIIEYNKKFGLIDYKGNFIIEPKYDQIYNLDRHLYGLIAYKEKNKIGLINEKGKVIINAKFDDVYGLGANKDYKGFYTSIKNNHEGIIDLKGNEITPPVYDQISVIKQNFYFIRKNNKAGILNSKGEEIVKPIYRNLTQITYDSTFLEIQNYFYAQDYKTKKIGIIDISGKTILPLNYDYIWLEENSIKNNSFFTTKLNDKLGVLNYKAQEVIPPRFDGIDTGYQNDIYYVKLNNKKGIINNNGKEILPPIYDDIGPKLYETYQINLGNKEGIVDKDGKEILPPIYDDLKFSKINNELKFIITILDEKYNLFNINIKEVSPTTYDYVSQFGNFIITEKENKYQLLNLTNNEYSPYYFTSQIYYPSLELMVIWDNGEYGILYENDKEIPLLKYTKTEVETKLNSLKK